MRWQARGDSAAPGIYAGKIDASKVAAMGMSCGGGMPPLTKDALKQFHGPALYILGGPSDIAYKNAMDDFGRVSHVPILMTNHSVGRGGTYYFVAERGIHTSPGPA